MCSSAQCADPQRVLEETEARAWVELVTGKMEYPIISTKKWEITKEKTRVEKKQQDCGRGEITRKDWDREETAKENVK